MAKKIKFALKMKDGAEVRTLKEFCDAFELEQVLAYFLDGRLLTWLEDRFYDEEAEKVSLLENTDPELPKKLCDIFGVEYKEDTLSSEEIAYRNEKLKKLKEITEDEGLLEKVDQVAFSQEELADLLNDGVTTIYLCGNDFVIPTRKKSMTYIGINTKLSLTNEQLKKYEENNIKFIDLLEKQSQPDNVYTNSKEQSEELMLPSSSDLIDVCESIQRTSTDASMRSFAKSAADVLKAVEKLSKNKSGNRFEINESMTKGICSSVDREVGRTIGENSLIGTSAYYERQQEQEDRTIENKKSQHMRMFFEK